MAFTKTQITKYLAHPDRCPYCNSTKILADSINYDDELWCWVTCSQCGKKWKDVYSLSGIEEEEEE